MESLGITKGHVVPCCWYVGCVLLPTVRPKEACARLSRTFFFSSRRKNQGRPWACWGSLRVKEQFHIEQKNTQHHHQQQYFHFDQQHRLLTRVNHTYINYTGTRNLNHHAPSCLVLPTGQRGSWCKKRGVYQLFMFLNPSINTAVVPHCLYIHVTCLYNSKYFIHDTGMQR